MKYEFHVPTDIRFGEGVVRLLPQLETVRGKRCLLLTYPGFDDPDLIAAIHVSSSFFVRSDAFEENPSHGLVRGLGRHLVNDEIDTIIAIGGGSTIDSAKGASWFAANPHYGEDGLDEISNDPSVQIVALPTTAGTGSEVSPFAVLTDAAAHRKSFIKHSALCPSVALCDPALTTTLPQSVTADTGIDAASHAVEAYLSNLCDGFLNDLSVGVLRDVFKYLPTVLKSPSDMDARSGMMSAALEGGLVLAACGTVIIHAIGYRINETIHVPHGRVNAMLMPAYIDHLADKGVNRAIEVQQLFGGDLSAFIESCGLPSSIPPQGVTQGDIDNWVDGAMVAYGLPNCITSLTETDVRKIVERAMDA